MKNFKCFFIFILIIFFQINLNPSNYKIHYLQDGETIYKLSKKYNIPIKDLCEINKIRDTTKVKVGAKIKIPVTSSDKVVKDAREQTQKVETKQTVSKKTVNETVVIKDPVKKRICSK